MSEKESKDEENGAGGDDHISDGGLPKANDASKANKATESVTMVAENVALNALRVAKDTVQGAKVIALPLQQKPSTGQKPSTEQQSPGGRHKRLPGTMARIYNFHRPKPAVPANDDAVRYVRDVRYVRGGGQDQLLQYRRKALASLKDCTPIDTIISKMLACGIPCLGQVSKGIAMDPLTNVEAYEQLIELYKEEKINYFDVAVILFQWRQPSNFTPQLINSVVRLLKDENYRSLRDFLENNMWRH